MGFARYLMEGPPVSWHNIRAGHQQVEARRRREAVQIERDQLTSMHKAELGRLQKLIEENNRECEVVTARLRWRWGWAHTIERGKLIGRGRKDDSENGKI